MVDYREKCFLFGIYASREKKENLGSLSKFDFCRWFSCSALPKTDEIFSSAGLDGVFVSLLGVANTCPDVLCKNTWNLHPLA